MAKGHLFPNKMNVQLNVLGPSMMHRVSEEVDHRDIVAVDHRGTVNRASQLLKQLTKPGTLGDGVGHRRYSASALERETVGCRLDDHDMSDGPRKTQ